MENLKLFAFIVAAVVVGEYLASAITWLAILSGGLEVAVSFIVIVYALMLSVLAEYGLYLLLAACIGAILFFVYRGHKEIRRIQ